jgi:hypothetical protein
VIEQDIVAALNADASFTALVGSRVYPLFRPQDGPLPAVVYQRLSTNPENSLLGFSHLDQVRIQFECFAKTVLEAKTLANVLRTAIDAAPSLKATCVYVADDIDADTRNFRVFVDYNFWQRY